ncbi:DUF5302 domain-containing protein [Cellulomonas sp.]|uniref:DUF5302 domain-containing protein n=1 Tax=Cellulomonas sp. TaxID=40001 RepID=UPI002585175C|nr:DUF5302 domain-containing protein [Cellulomonas sp.]MCR6689719.1 DUF5302 domain-containing protein [Cellulomonas sp.]
MTDDQRQAGDSIEDQKAKFREALERKKAGGHRVADGTANTGAVHGSETSGPAQRRFQRKSGAS